MGGGTAGAHDERSSKTSLRRGRGEVLLVVNAIDMGRWVCKEEIKNKDMLIQQGQGLVLEKLIILLVLGYLPNSFPSLDRLRPPASQTTMAMEYPVSATVPRYSVSAMATEYPLRTPLHLNLEVPRVSPCTTVPHVRDGPEIPGLLMLRSRSTPHPPTCWGASHRQW